MKNNKKNLEISWYTKNKVQSFFKKVSFSFLFVIILMPIFGFTIAIGNVTKIKILVEFGSILFSNIGFWFTLALTIGFTNNKASAIFSCVLSYFIFNFFISIFIVENENINLFNIWFWKNLNKKVYLTKIFFTSLETFNSGIISSIFVSFYVILIFNKFKNQKLIKGLQIFEKERLVIIINTFASIIASCIFIIIYPIIGYLFSFLGRLISYAPIGIDSFVFRIVQRALIPFGANLLWQTPLWYTQVGGSLIDFQQDLLISYLIDNCNLNENVIEKLKNISQKYKNENEIIDLINQTLKDDINLSFEMKEWFFNTKDIINKSGDQLIWIEILNNKYITIDNCWKANLRITRFITGGYINSMFVLPSICLAYWLNQEKNNRKQKTSYFLSASLTAFLLGISEPAEYIFCYSMPLFYFLIYCPLNGLMGFFTSIFKIKVGTSFSTGFFDFTLNGIVPSINKNNLKVYNIFAIGFCFALISFIICYFYFKYFLKKEKSKDLQLENDKNKVVFLITLFNGFKNIKQISFKQDFILVNVKKQLDLTNDFFVNFNKIEKENKNYKFYFKEQEKNIFLLMKKIMIYKKIKIVD